MLRELEGELVDISDAVREGDDGEGRATGEYSLDKVTEFGMAFVVRSA